MSQKNLCLLTLAMMTLVACADNHTQSDARQRAATEQTLTPDPDYRGFSIQLSERYIAPARDDLAAKLGVDTNTINYLHAIPVIWNDGSLGCPQPDHAYTQALVPGYWVLLEHEGKRYSYHASRTGPFSHCDNASFEASNRPPHGRYDADV